MTAIAASTVAWLVRSPGTTSIIGMRWGGLDQCITTTRSGCCRSAAILVAGMPDVLEAMTTSGPMCCSYSA